MPDRLASVTCVGGLRFVEPPSGRLPPLLAIHGELDTVNPIRGGNEPRWSESVESVIRRWAPAFGCETMPRDRSVSDEVREIGYVDSDECTDGEPVCPVETAAVLSECAAD